MSAIKEKLDAIESIDLMNFQISNEQEQINALQKSIFKMQGEIFSIQNKWQLVGKEAEGIWC